MNLLTRIPLHCLIHRSAAARAYSVQRGFIYLVSVTKKQDSRNKTEDVISLSVVYLHICAIKAQKAPEIIRHVDEVHPCPQRARHFPSRILIWQMILKFYIVFSFERFGMLFASTKALQTNPLRIPVPTLCNIQKVHKVTGKRKPELGRRTMTRGSKREKTSGQIDWRRQRQREGLERQQQPRVWDVKEARGSVRSYWRRLPAVCCRRP